MVILFNTIRQKDLLVHCPMGQSYEAVSSISSSASPLAPSPLQELQND